MTPEEKIEALREWANRPVTDGAQLASLNWYREAQREVRDIIDPPLRLYGYKHVVNAVALIVQQQAQIARVRELADTWMSDGAAWGPYSARCILDALDGER